MKDKVFFDTNILIYSIDASEQKKHDITLQLLENAIKNESIQISTQSIQEVTNVIAKKKNYSEQTVTNTLNFLASLPTYINTTKTIIHAKDIMYKNKLSFWDSLILAAANEAGCKTLYSEDLNAGQIIIGEIYGFKILFGLFRRATLLRRARYQY